MFYRTQNFPIRSSTLCNSENFSNSGKFRVFSNKEEKLAYAETGGSSFIFVQVEVELAIIMGKRKSTSELINDGPSRILEI